MKIINAVLRAGVWTGELVEGSAKNIQVLHNGHRLEGVELSPLPDRGSQHIKVPIPASAISDGVQTFVVQDETGHTLTQFTILAGDVLAQDLRAEVDLLRAELDLLKQAFRRHCGEC